MSLPNPLAAAMARVRNKNLHVWTAGYARWLARTTPARARAAFTPGGGPRHLLFALCDHYEPHWKNTDVGVGTERVRAWLHGYPALVGPYRDSDGLPPRHSFFFPGEEYRPPTSTRSPAWRAAVSARSSCTCTTTATRPTGCAPRSRRTCASSTATAT